MGYLPYQLVQDLVHQQYVSLPEGISKSHCSLVIFFFGGVEQLECPTKGVASLESWSQLDCRMAPDNL